jgi:hypothetical protein
MDAKGFRERHNRAKAPNCFPPRWSFHIRRPEDPTARRLVGFSLLELRIHTANIAPPAKLMAGIILLQIGAIYFIAEKGGPINDPYPFRLAHVPKCSRDKSRPRFARPACRYACLTGRALHDPTTNPRALPGGQVGPTHGDVDNLTKQIEHDEHAQG